MLSLILREKKTIDFLCNSRKLLSNRPKKLQLYSQSRKVFRHVFYDFYVKNSWSFMRDRRLKYIKTFGVSHPLPYILFTVVIVLIKRNLKTQLRIRISHLCLGLSTFLTSWIKRDPISFWTELFAARFYSVRAFLFTYFLEN